MLQSDSEVSPPRSIILLRISQKYQKLLDNVTPYTLWRWVFAVIFILAFMSRVFIMQGWYIIMYALGIYHLNLLIGFLTPKSDFEFFDDCDDDQAPSLPTRQDEEYRPFIRRLPEFKFWCSIVRSTIIALTTTFFEMFNVPVFWPILVFYFIVLFCITMKRQISHMIKYRYIPINLGKPKYQSSKPVIVNS